MSYTRQPQCCKSRDDLYNSMQRARQLEGGIYSTTRMQPTAVSFCSAVLHKSYDLSAPTCGKKPTERNPL